MMFSSISFAGWTKVGKNVIGKTFYVDFKRIRKFDGYVYFWWLIDYLKSTTYNDLSVKMYEQGDCKLFRIKNLHWTFHQKLMGRGDGIIEKITDKWKYPLPDSSGETVLKTVCANLK